MSGEEMGERKKKEGERGEKKAITAAVWLCWFTACKCQMQHRFQCVCVCFFGILVAYIVVLPRIVYVMHVIPTASTYLFCFASKK